MYDPVVGRWLEEDPDGFAAGDDNLYRYVGNGPTDGTDPSGDEPQFGPPTSMSMSTMGGYGGIGGPPTGVPLYQPKVGIPNNNKPVLTNQDGNPRLKSLLEKARPINKKALQVTLQFAQDIANAPRWQAAEVKSKLPETAWEVMELWFLPGGLAENALIGMSGLAAPPGAASTGLGAGMIYDLKSDPTYQWGTPTRPNSRGAPEREEPAKTIEQLLDEQSRVNPKDSIAAARIAKARERLMALQLRGPAGLAEYELGRKLTKGEANDLQARLDDIPGYKELGKEFLDILHSIAITPKGALEGRRAVEVTNTKTGNVITDIDEIKGGVLWEEKSATFATENAKWVEKHITEKFNAYLEARMNLPGYENAPIGFKFTAGKPVDPALELAIIDEISRLRKTNPGVDIRLEW